MTRVLQALAACAILVFASCADTKPAGWATAARQECADRGFGDSTPEMRNCIARVTTAKQDRYNAATSSMLQSPEPKPLQWVAMPPFRL
jgi:hypothetical protein